MSSCITVPKKWAGSTAPRSELITPMVPVAAIQKRTTKKARSSPQLVDTVREVVQAFELEYSQVRAESVELKGILDDRRTQLVDLRKHLEKESGDNGTLEAVVQHRSSVNANSDARLANLESEFCAVLENDRIIAERAATLESDLSVLTEEWRLVGDKTNIISAQLARAEAALDKRDHTFAEGLKESERLSSALQASRRKVDEVENETKKAKERASKSISAASDTAAELEALKEKMVHLQGDVDAKEADNTRAASDAAETERQAKETLQMIREDYAIHMRGVRDTQDRLAETKRLMEDKENSNVELESRIQVLQQAVAAESEAQDAKRSKIAAMRTNRKETVEAEIRDISAQVEAKEADVAQKEEAARKASERIKEANMEFSNLMAAMSTAFSEYDQVVTSNREMESEIGKAKGKLVTIRERSEQDLVAVRQVIDKLSSSNEENRMAAEADRQLAKVLNETVRETQKTVDDMTSEIETNRAMIATCEKNLEEANARKRAQDEKKAEQLRSSKEAYAAAQENSREAQDRLEEIQTELTNVRKQTAEKICTPVVLNEGDLQRIENEAKQLVEKSRVDKDEAHATRLQSLKSTLATIREGGAARLKAEADAAKARITALQDQKQQVLRSLEKHRARVEAAQQMEKSLEEEIRNREKEAQRIAQEQAAAAVAVAQEQAAAAAAAAAQEQAAAAAAAREQAIAAAVAAAQEQAAAAAAAREQVAAAEAREQATAAAVAEAQEQPAAAAQEQATAAAAAAHAEEPRAEDPRKAYSNYTNTNLCSTNKSPTGMRALDTPVDQYSIQNTIPERKITSGHSNTTLATPNVPPECHVTSEFSRARFSSCVGDSFGRMGVQSALPDGDGEKYSPDDHQGVIFTIGERAPRGNDLHTHAGRPKRSSRPSSRDPATRSQHASESTAEVAGSRQTSATGAKHGNHNGGQSGSASRYKKKEKSSVRAAPKPNANARPDGEQNKRSSKKRGNDTTRGRQRSDTSRKSRSRSNSGSPRIRPSSPRPVDKEYDLWTDNRLVGDSDFSFF